MPTLKVATKTDPQKLAGAIVGQLKTDKKIAIECIGAEALNQTIKACIIARGFVAPNGYAITLEPSFVDIASDRGETSGIRLIAKLTESI